MSEQDHTETEVPSATVPDETVQPHGGQVPGEWEADGSYNDGNLDARGVEPAAGEPQADPDGGFASLDDDLDTSPRTDGRGHPDDAADAANPDPATRARD